MKTFRLEFLSHHNSPHARKIPFIMTIECVNEKDAHAIGERMQNLHFANGVQFVRVLQEN